jgi:hypothetical protein
MVFLPIGIPRDNLQELGTLTARLGLGERVSQGDIVHAHFSLQVTSRTDPSHVSYREEGVMKDARGHEDSFQSRAARGLWGIARPALMEG